VWDLVHTIRNTCSASIAVQQHDILLPAPREGADVSNPSMQFYDSTTNLPMQPLKGSVESAAHTQHAWYEYCLSVATDQLVSSRSLSEGAPKHKNAVQTT
jgi:hypothetical protein